MKTIESTNHQNFNEIIHQMKTGIGEYNNGSVQVNTKRVKAVHDAILHLEMLLKGNTEGYLSSMR